MTDNVVPGTFTPYYTSRNRVTHPPMYTHGGSSFPRVITPFGQGRRVSRASYQSLVPRSGFSFLVPDSRSSFRILVPRSGFSFLVPDLTYRFITIFYIEYILPDQGAVTPKALPTFTFRRGKIIHFSPPVRVFLYIYAQAKHAKKLFDNNSA